MLSTIDSKLREPNWVAFQNTSIDDVFRLQTLLSAEATSAAFSGAMIDNLTSHVVVRLWVVDDETAARLQIETWRRIKELRHPNLIRILGAGRTAGGEDALIYIVIEPADEGLGNALRERPLQSDEAIEILKSVVAALDYLHSNGYVHGALSPDQIFAVGDDVKLSSEPIRRADTEGGVSAVMAKYLAPESKTVNMTTAADIWCAGAALVECLTQHSPAAGITEYPELPDPLRTVVRRSLDPDPASRCTLAEMIDIYSRKAAKLVKVEMEPLAEKLETVQKPERVMAAPVRVERPLTLQPKSLKSSSGVPLWAYGAGSGLIIVILIWLLYPKPAAQKPGQTPPGSLPAAQQKVIQPAGEQPASPGTPNRLQARKPSPLRSSSEPKRAQSLASSMGSRPEAEAASKNGSVWRVIVYAYNRRDEAERKAQTINQTRAQLKAEAFSPDGNNGPYLVVVGGGMSRDEARRFRRDAVRAGMPRDSYFQNFTH